MIQGTLSDTLTQIYTLPASKTAQVKAIKIHNTSGSGALVTLNSKLNGTGIPFDQLNMEAYDSVEIALSYPFEYSVAGDGIEASCSVDAVANYFIMFREEDV